MGQTDWHSINWKRANRSVRNLRQRIFKATQAGDINKVRQLQKLMLRSYSNTLICVRKVTQVNAGKHTPGMDKVVIKTPKAREELIEAIHSYQPWRSCPARRVYIPKPNGKQQPLGIPTILDRTHQARVKNALEPQWEACFEGSSYGFRPGRSCHDAIMAIYSLAHAGSRRRWIVDADIKGAFDNISHEFLLKAIGNFPAKGLIKQWLKAGYVDKNVFYETNSGTPQGGIISPLLANIALHGMEEMLKIVRWGCKKTNAGNRALVRYADDFVVFCESEEDTLQVIEDLKIWLSNRGLSLSEEKTRVVHITEGFDFLGFNIRQYTQASARKGVKLLIKPSKKSVLTLKDNLRILWKHLRGARPIAITVKLNPIIRGWANYYRMANASKTFSYLDTHMFNKAVRWAKSTHNNKSWKYITKKYWGRWNKACNDKWVFGDKNTFLYKFSWVKIKRHVQVKSRSSKDDPALKTYWEDREARKGRNLTKEKQIIAFYQKYKCPVCHESLFNGEELHDHHIIADKKNIERNLLKNRRMLHLFCHQKVHFTNLPDATKDMRELLK